MTYNEDSSVSGHDEPWIQWFCGLKGHEMFCEVERAYIEDGFNLYGLRTCVPCFSDCLDLMLDRIGPDDSDDSNLTQSACTLYGLIHARYIITAHGLDAMYNKYAAKEFGTCPLVQCSGQPVLPVGVKDEVGVDTVKVFCPKCQCVYIPPPIRSRGGVDGASFGTTFPHLFLMTFSNLVPDGLSPDSVYVPRIFGFRVHQSARQRNGTPAMLASVSSSPPANNSLPLPPPPPPPASASASASAAFNTKWNSKAGPATVAICEQGQVAEKDSTLPNDGVNESPAGAEQNSKSASASASASAGICQGEDQSKTNENDQDQEEIYEDDGSTPLNRNQAAESKTKEIGGQIQILDQSTIIDGNSSSCAIKRKSKTNNATASISNAQSDSNGKSNTNVDSVEVSQKSKAKRQKRPNNGVT